MLSEANKERVRYHLGYMVVVVPGSMAFSIPQVTETQWLFEDAVTRIRPESEPRVIKTLDYLDEIECRLFNASGELFAKRAGDLEPNLSQPDDIEREYVRWACRLADMLGVFAYPYSDRFKTLANNGGKAFTISVRR